MQNIFEWGVCCTRVQSTRWNSFISESHMSRCLPLEKLIPTCAVSPCMHFSLLLFPLSLSLSPSTSFRHRLSIKQNESLNYDFTGCCWFLLVDSSCAVCVYVVLIFITACPCAFSLSPDWCESHHSIIANKFPPVPRRRTVRMLQKKKVEQTVKTLVGARKKVVINQIRA